jgi:hypothetical protein
MRTVQKLPIQERAPHGVPFLPGLTPLDDISGVDGRYDQQAYGHRRCEPTNHPAFVHPVGDRSHMSMRHRNFALVPY